MSTTVTVSIEEARRLLVSVLVAHDTAPVNAASVAEGLLAAEIDGQKGHGLSRLPSYAAQAASGKVDGHAIPRVVDDKPSAVRIDAGNGFAFTAVDLAIESLVARAPTTGIAAAGIFRSHHIGQVGYHVERLARRGLLTLAFSNSPGAIAPWGGYKPLFGTNPIAFAAPRAGDLPLVIDLSLSKVARGKVMVAAQSGEPIPGDWALDLNGKPTTDAQAALKGTMIPMGDAKGAALVLMVEVLAAALTGANFGYQSSSFFDAEGAPPGVGQFLIAIDPDVFSGGGFAQRLEILLDAMLEQQGVRLPGSRREQIRARAASDGLAVPKALYDKISSLA
jgi:(2R)-3-sulfolactate dehydrogenase (NADP+)